MRYVVKLISMLWIEWDEGNVPILKTKRGRKNAQVKSILYEKVVRNMGDFNNAAYHSVVRLCTCSLMPHCYPFYSKSMDLLRICNCCFVSLLIEFFILILFIIITLVVLLVFLLSFLYLYCSSLLHWLYSINVNEMSLYLLMKIASLFC